MVQTIVEGTGHHFVGLENILITFYASAPPASALRQREGWISKTLQSYDKVALLVVVDSLATGTLPGPEFRAVSREQATRWKDSVACSAVVLESDSFWFGLLRGFLRSLSLVIRPPFPVRYFASPQEAAPFALESAGSSMGEARLCEVVESIREGVRDSMPKPSTPPASGF